MPTSTVDRLLVQIGARATRLAPHTVVILDEAAMCSTRRRLALQQAVDAVGGKVIDIGDDRQIPSVDVGGVFHALGATLGASTLGVNHRFRDPQYRDDADLIWQGHHDQAIATLEAAGAVYEHPHPNVVNGRMIQDWADLRADGHDASCSPPPTWRKGRPLAQDPLPEWALTAKAPQCASGTTMACDATWN